MKKIRVHKLRPGEENRGWPFPTDRPWIVSDDPVDSRETCWPNLGAALAWATMHPAERKAKIDHDDAMDGGW